MSSQQERWQLAGTAAEVYQEHLVPAIFAPWAPVVVESASLRPGERVLDVACGTGAVAREAAPRVVSVGPSSAWTSTRACSRWRARFPLRLARG